MIGEKQLRELILTRLAAPLLANGLTPDAVPDDFDLLREGVVDSLGFVELIGVIEAAVGMPVDFEDLDPEQLTVVGPLCRYVESKVRAGGAGGGEGAR